MAGRAKHSRHTEVYKHRSVHAHIHIRVHAHTLLIQGLSGMCDWHSLAQASARREVKSAVGGSSVCSRRQRKEELPFEFKARQFGYTWSKPKGSVDALARTAHDVANQHWQH